MGYPIYKLLRAVNRQYPNNGFINYVDVREDMYDNTESQMIDEDLRDLINETIQEVYKDVAIDEVYSFPTVPGQNQYVLPEDCDLRDIQEVTRTFCGIRGPLPIPPKPGPGPGPEPPTFTVTAFFDANGGTGEMPPLEVNFGESITLPTCSFLAPTNQEFKCWEDNAGNEHLPGETIPMYEDETFSAIWKPRGTGHRYSVSFYNATNDDRYITLKYKPLNGIEESVDLYYLQRKVLTTGTDSTLGSAYEYIRAFYGGAELSIDVNMSKVYTHSEDFPIVHPTIEPEGEGTGHRPTTE